MIPMLIGGGLGLVTFAIYYLISNKLDEKKKAKRRKVSNQKLSKEKNKKESAKRIEHKIGFRTIQNNVAENHDGTINCTIDYSTPDIGSLNDEEVELYEEQLNRFALSLKFPIKVITMIGKVTYRKSNDKIYETINSGLLSEGATNYSLQLAQALESKQYDRKEFEKKKYLVVGAKDKSEKERIRILKQRATLVMTNLTRSNIHYNMLETIEKIDFFNEYINHGSRIDLIDAEKKGIFELYSTSDMTIGGDSNE
ncbi:hypothetical protein HZI73_26175 (plasmid) [Vallitalea pronyensis]|uniref:Uncharacterized protein n=1 Tax=Vallitalea pronyensis TaxID=1348613 RepID=A0A8J8SJW0_9FIRM|nr:hypothetical protein [Vallitalea pronyensis]QUI25902.1 hypothetical protein HZI73_26175 [Vallitalea pronyensis]